MDTIEGIRSVSETGADVLGEQGRVAMIQSVLDGHTSPPPSVATLLPQPELMDAADTEGSADVNGTNLRDEIQVLDTIRHMKKGWEESLAFCSDLVRVILQSVDTYADEAHDELGQDVLGRLSGMNNVSLTVAALNPSKVPPSPGEVIKKMVEIMGRKPFPGARTVSAQPGMFALWGSAPRS